MGHTKKVGIAGKYGTRYGASLRKQSKKIEMQQRARYQCPFCGKQSTRRNAVGIWQCRICLRKMAGGAFIISTSAALTAKTTISRLRKQATNID